MKLDKIGFAMVVNFVCQLVKDGRDLDGHDVNRLDELIDIEVAEAPAASSYINPEQLHVLMALMQEGTSKIEAIRQYRMMTGCGLKDSKDIVEKYWPNFIAVERAGKEKLSVSMVNKLHQQISNPGEEYYLLKNFTAEQLELVKQFIESF